MGLKKHIKLFEEFSGSNGHPGFFTTREETEAWLEKMGVKGYTINDDLTVDVDGGVDLISKKLTRFPVQFGRVEGDFKCYINQLTSLVGAPSSVGKDFWCYSNQLTSLVGAPESVGWQFDCDNNRLTTLKGAPSSVKGNFWCRNNQLTSLEHAPSSVGESFYCDNNQLTSLVGAPSTVGGSFYCDDNPILIPHLPAKVDGIVESDVELYSNRAKALKAMDPDSFFDVHREAGTDWSELRQDIESEPDLLKHLADHFGSEEVLWRIWSGYKMASHDDDKLGDIGIWD